MSDHSSEVATRAITGNDKRHWAASEVLDIAINPLKCIPAIIGSGRVAVFGRQTISGQNNHRLRAGRQMATHGQVIIDAANDPAAAMIVDDHGFRWAWRR